MAIRPRTLTSPPTAALPVAAPTAPPRTVAKRPARRARHPPIADRTARIVIPVGRVGMVIVPPRTVPGRTPESGRSYSLGQGPETKWRPAATAAGPAAAQRWSRLPLSDG